MTVAAHTPDHVELAIAGTGAAHRTLDAIRAGIALPDRLLEDLIDVIAADGGPPVRTERLRAFARTLQKTLEGSPPSVPSGAGAHQSLQAVSAWADRARHALAVADVRGAQSACRHADRELVMAMSELRGLAGSQT